MVNAFSVVHKYIEASISFTDSTHQSPTRPPSKATPPKTENPTLKRLQRQKEQLDKAIDKEMEKKAQAPAEPNPNDDPMGLFGQVRPILVKMGLVNMADPSKTELVSSALGGPKDTRLYKVTLRRTAQIIPDTIERIKRQESFFSYMEWTSKALCVYVWWEYTTEAR